MTNKAKSVLVGLVANIPIHITFWVLLLRHIQATTVIWLLFWIGWFISQIITYMMNTYFKQEELWVDQKKGSVNAS